MCRVSLNTIRDWSKRGLLHPRTAPRKQSTGATRVVAVYDPHELAKMMRRRGDTRLPDEPAPGELAARAFELFDGGHSLREVVTRLRQEPSRVAELHDQWLDLGGSELVITPVARRELERVIGPFDGVAGLVERVVDLGQRAHEPAKTAEAVGGDDPAAKG